MESNTLTNPFVHYMTKAFVKKLDSNGFVNLIKGKQVLFIKKTKYSYVKPDISFRGEGWKLEKLLKEDDIVYLIRPSGDAENAQDSIEKILAGYKRYEYSYGGRVILENDLTQIVYDILKNGFTNYYSSLLELQTCISCQLEQATLKDRITGLKFCSQECFDEFGI